MKKIWLVLFISLFLLVGCGLETVAENTTSSMSQSGNQFDEFQATSVWTDMRPLSNTPKAGVVFEVETTLKSGESITLYGAGTLTVTDDSFTFEDEASIQGQGQGILKVPAGAFDVPDNYNSCIYVPRVVGLTAQIDGVKAGPTDITIEGIVTANNGKEALLDCPGIPISDNAEVREVSCYGRVLPGSNLTLIEFLDFKDNDGSMSLYGGVVDLGSDFTPPTNNPGPFTCEKGSAITAAATDVPTPGSGTSVVVVDLERVMFNFLESNQTYQVENGSGYMLGLSLEQ